MRYSIITPLPYATEDPDYAVETTWGWDLIAHLGFFEDLHVFAPLREFDPGRFPYKLSGDRINFHTLPDSDGPLQFIGNLAGTLSILLHDLKKDDIIHCECSTYPPYGIIACILSWMRGFRRRIFVIDGDVVRDLEVAIKSEKRFLKRLAMTINKCYSEGILKLCVSISPLTFVVGEALRRRYGKYGNVVEIWASWVRGSDIIPNILLDTKLKDFRCNNQIRIMFCGRLIPKKGPEVSVAAAGILIEKGYSIILDIFGNGPMEKPLEDLIQKNHLGNAVKMRGVIRYDRLYDTMRQYDILVVPNLSAEQPRVIFDAMANGVAVICPRTAQFEEVVLDGENGLLCDRVDPHCFAAAIEQIIQDRNILDRIVRGGVQLVQGNTIESAHAKRAKCIMEVLLGERTAKKS